MATRLPFRLPEWAPRTTWASAHAREVWAPRIQRVSHAYVEVERDLVAAGVRPSALQNVTPEELPELMKALAPRGLIVLPLTQTPRPQGYTSATRSAKPGEPLDYRCAITRPEHAAAWADAWSRSDNDVIGALLGYPGCCRQFFEQVWVVERWIDTTWPMTREKRSQVVKIDPGGINPLWRWHGVRLVSHLPCSFTCEPSAVQARQTLEIMQQRWPEETAWLVEILSWPVKWTALHAIAEITTPIHRTSVPTDATVERLEVRYLGNGYPAEGAIGIGFPQRTTATPPVTIPVARRSAVNPADNGFSSLAAMQAAHRAILQVAGPGPYTTILDLGCGDGTLISQIPARRRVGIESQPMRAKLAGTRLDRVVAGSCTDANLIRRVLQEEQPDLILAQATRNPPESFEGRWRVLSYSYEPGASKPAIVEPNTDMVDREAA